MKTGKWIVAAGLVVALCAAAVASSNQGRSAALNQKTKVRTEASKLALSYYNAAWNQVKEGNCRPAVQLFNEAIKLVPQDERLYAERGDCRFDLCDFEGAIRDYSTAISLGLVDGDVYYSRALALSSLDNYFDSIKDLQKAIVLCPQETRYKASLANAMGFSGDSAGALSIRKSLIPCLKGDDAQGNFVGMARLYIKMGNKTEARAAITKVLAIQPGAPETYVLAGQLRNELGEFSQAVEAFNRALALAPGHVNALCGRAYSKDLLNDFAAAVVDFDSAIELEPENHIALVDKGYTLLKWGRCKSALAAFSGAVRLKPEIGAIYAARALAYEMNGDYDAAISDLNKSIELRPRSWFPYIYRAKFFLRTRSYNLALQDYLKAFSFNKRETLERVWEDVSQHLVRCKSTPTRKTSTGSANSSKS